MKTTKDFFEEEIGNYFSNIGKLLESQTILENVLDKFKEHITIRTILLKNIKSRGFLSVTITYKENLSMNDIGKLLGEFNINNYFVRNSTNYILTFYIRYV